jgi:pyruvate formate lyase activating enzyme
MEIKCVGVERCGKCVSVCPSGAISPAAVRRDTLTDEDITLVKVDRSRCVSCFKCAQVCVHKALYVCGKEYTVDELMERIVKDRPFYEQSGGGVTFSGGECLWQPEYLLEVLKKCKAEGIHTAVDTTGYVNRRFLEPTIPFTDLYLYDIKQMNSELHRQLTGVSNDLILENARFLAQAGAKLQIRIPVIPLFNDDEASFEAAGKFILELGDAVEVVQLLPYHNLGVVKWARLGRATPVFEADPPSDDLMQARKSLLTAMGLNVVIH